MTEIDTEIQISGSVQLRRDRCATTTADQRLLDRHDDTRWLHTDPWRVLRIQGEFVEGFDALAEIPKAVTVFGSSRTEPDSAEYGLGRELGTALALPGAKIEESDLALIHCTDSVADAVELITASGR